MAERFVLEEDDYYTATSEYFEDLDDLYDDGTPKSYWFNDHEDFVDTVSLLNELSSKCKQLEKEKENWKSSCLSKSSENSILWNEISIMREQGAEPSDAFEKYILSKRTEYDEFWSNKIKKYNTVMKK